MPFYEQLETLKNVQLETTIYLTRSSKLSASDQDSEDEKQSRESDSLDIVHIKSCLSHINFVEFKPRVDDIVRCDIEEASEAIIIVYCGHPMLVDEVSYAVVQSLAQNKDKLIHFYEALQVWA